MRTPDSAFDPRLQWGSGAWDAPPFDDHQLPGHLYHPWDTDACGCGLRNRLVEPVDEGESAYRYVSPLARTLPPLFHWRDSRLPKLVPGEDLQPMAFREDWQGCGDEIFRCRGGVIHAAATYDPYGTYVTWDQRTLRKHASFGYRIYRVEAVDGIVWMDPEFYVLAFDKNLSENNIKHIRNAEQGVCRARVLQDCTYQFTDLDETDPALPPGSQLE